MCAWSEIRDDCRTSFLCFILIESKSSRRDSSASIESNSPVSFRKKKKGKHATRKKVKKARMDTVAAQDSVEELSVQEFLADEETAGVVHF